MATDHDFMDYVLEQMRCVRNLSSRKMFGEYAIYCDEKVVALVCDNQLYVKPTQSGRDYIGEDSIIEAPAYPGAKPSFVIGEQLESADWLCSLIQLTADALPLPKPKSKRRPLKT